MIRRANRKNRQLRMPSSFADMSSEEMDYSGGWLSTVCFCLTGVFFCSTIGFGIAAFCDSEKYDLWMGLGILSLFLSACCLGVGVATLPEQMPPSLPDPPSRLGTGNQTQLAIPNNDDSNALIIRT